jgi:signal transduction histidine kinase
MCDELAHVTLARDGLVMAVDNCPIEWLKTDLSERADTPADLKSALQEMLSAPQPAPEPLVRDVWVASLDKTVRLTVVEALPIRRSPVDLRGLFESSLTALHRQAEPVDVTIRAAVDATVPPSVMIDGEKVAWLLTVLVGNALRYVPQGSNVMPGGTIVVSASYDSAARTIAIEVQDDGPGIPADTRAALFHSGPSQPRVGLGLVMVFDVVVAHGGRLDVDSNLEGTRVRVTLPVW